MHGVVRNLQVRQTVDSCVTIENEVTHMHRPLHVLQPVVVTQEIDGISDKYMFGALCEFLELGRQLVQAIVGQVQGLQRHHFQQLAVDSCDLVSTVMRITCGTTQAHQRSWKSAR